MVQIYKEPLCRRYYSSIFGEATVFRVVAHLSAIVLAFVVAFATGGFWVKLKLDTTQAAVHYTHDALLTFEGPTAMDVSVWSTSPALIEDFPDSFVAANVQVAEEDLNDDGLPDVITFRAQAAPTHPVYGVKALLQFRYKLSSNIKLEMYSLGYVAYNSALQGSALCTDGELMFVGRNQITDRHFNSVYNLPMLNSSMPSYGIAAQPSIQLQYQSIISAYLDRNYTTMYSNVYPVWVGGSTNEFTLEMTIRIPPNQVIFYRPQVIEMLKGGWIQWLATYIVAWYLLRWIEWFVFYFRLLSVRVSSDIQPKAQKF